MRIWLDDTRDKPYNYDLHFYKAEDVIDYIKNNNIITHISFDNDLGINNLEGYQLANWIEEQAYYNNIKEFTWNIHSANPVGRKKIEKAMNNARKYWSEHN